MAEYTLHASPLKITWIDPFKDRTQKRVALSLDHTAIIASEKHIA